MRRLASTSFLVFLSTALISIPLWLDGERPSPSPRSAPVGADPDGVVFRSAARGDRPLGALIRAREHRDAMLRHDEESGAPQATAIDPDSWTFIGPPDVGGRIRAILIHPADPDTMWVGAATGGIWKTIDGGQSWTPLNDFMASLTIGCMAMDPLNPDILYAGTGEGFFSAAQGSSNTAAIQGEGIFKSFDGGTTWFLLPATGSNPDFIFVNRIAVAPTTSNILLAATGTGIFRSIDSGNTWSSVHPDASLDVKFHPFDSLLAVAAQRNGAALHTTDGGQNWQVATGVPVEGFRTELAYGTSSPNVVYAATHNSDDGMFALVSTNFGADYVRVTDPPATEDDRLWQKGRYGKALWVDPFNSDRLLMGGRELYYSLDGGETFTEMDSGHDDHHVLIEHPSYGALGNTTVFNGNDGGIYSMDFPFTASPNITDLNNGLAVTQFYGADIHPSGRVVGGTQDNGTYTLAPQAQQWEQLKGADGAYSAITPYDPDRLYYQIQKMRVYRTDDGGGNEVTIFDSEVIGEIRPNFIAPLQRDGVNTDRLYLGGLSLWRSFNPSSPEPQWTAIKDPIPTCPPPAPLPSPPADGPSHESDNPECNISAIAVSPQNLAWLWVGYNNGEVWSTTNGGFNAPIWNRRDENGVGLPDRWVSDIVADPFDENVAYVSFMGYEADSVWKTEDFGASWTNISGAGLNALPELPVSGLAVHPILPGWLYAATDLGIYTSEDDGATWSASNVGPSNVSVDELDWKDDKTLMAVTHGRGLWTVETFDDCNGNFVPDDSDIGSGTSLDANSNGIPDECENALPPGRIDPAVGQITLDRVLSDVLIHCPGSCAPGVLAYGVYEGTIGSWYSHKAVSGMCQASCSSAFRVTPSPGNTYYLVVPHNFFAEGSYGTDFDTAQVKNERPRPVLPTERCAEFQMITTCP